MPKTTADDARRQARFCMELMARLNTDIQEAEEIRGQLDRYTVMAQDTVRLRRELSRLKKLLDPWSE